MAERSLVDCRDQVYSVAGDPRNYLEGPEMPRGCETSAPGSTHPKGMFTSISATPPTKDVPGKDLAELGPRVFQLNAEEVVGHVPILARGGRHPTTGGGTPDCRENPLALSRS
jgi:hypothetical protein